MSDNQEDSQVVKVRTEKPKEVEPVSSGPPATPRLIRVHFHLGKLCRSEAIDQTRDFVLNKTYILDQFGIGKSSKSEREKLQEHKKYVLRLRDGGVVETNNVLFQDDHVLIVPKEDFLKQQAQQQDRGDQHQVAPHNDQDVEMTMDEAGRHKVQVGEDGGKRSQVQYKNLSDMKLKNLRNIFANNNPQTAGMEGQEEQLKSENQSSNISGQCVPGMDKSTKLETMSLNSQHIKYKQLLKKKCKTGQPEGLPHGPNKEQVQQIDICAENAQSSAKWQETDHIIRKIDYDGLELSLYKKQISDYHDLLEHVNIWAVHLGFLVKLKRPPKLNQDGSKTLRVYCASYKKSKPLFMGTGEDLSSVGGRGSIMKTDAARSTTQLEANQSMVGPSVIDRSDVQSQASGTVTCGRVEGGVRTCNFALTFKADTSTDCWLMYQEYHKEQMMHTHQLDVSTFDNIREYIAQYTEKVRSLTELKELIYERFGLEYTLNQISYFRGKWTAEAYIYQKDEQALQDDDYNNLIKLLKKNPGDCLDYEFDDQDPTNLKFLFFSSAKMKEVYQQSSDIVFINKRFTLNRFKRPIMLWFTVANSGQSQLVAFSMYEREEAYYFTRVSKCFMDQMDSVAPKTIIIERQLKLHQALKETCPTSQVLFCYYHILKTLKTQYAFLEREKPEEFKMLTDLPIIDTVVEFEAQLKDVEQFKYKNEYHQLIIQKMSSEKQKMTKCFHMQYFTGGISVCQRNEQIKAYLKPVLKKRDCSIAEILKRILSLSSKEFKLSQEFQIVSPKHDQVFQTAHFLARVKELCPSYGYQRVKWNIAKGFRFEIKEDNEHEWVIIQKASASQSKKTWQLQSYTVKKVRLTRKGIERLGGDCPCRENQHTGFPCPHLCLLNYKGKVEWLEINPRWYKHQQGGRSGTINVPLQVEAGDVVIQPLQNEVDTAAIAKPSEDEIGEETKDQGKPSLEEDAGQDEASDTDNTEEDKNSEKSDKIPKDITNTDNKSSQPVAAE